MIEPAGVIKLSTGHTKWLFVRSERLLEVIPLCIISDKSFRAMLYVRFKDQQYVCANRGCWGSIECELLLAWGFCAFVGFILYMFLTGFVKSVILRYVNTRLTLSMAVMAVYLTVLRGAFVFWLPRVRCFLDCCICIHIIHIHITGIRR